MEATSSSDSYSTSCSIDSPAAPSVQLALTSISIVQELAQGHGDVRIYLVENEQRQIEVLKTSRSSLEREGRMMEKVRGHNIVRLSRRGEDERLGSWLLMEWCESGDLFRLVKKCGSFPERVARIVLSQILGALQTCHNTNIAHLDVKLENCYVCRDGTVKLGDFGHSRTNSSSMKNLNAGTLQYQAPEIRSKQPYDGCCADVFSLGVCAFNLLYGRRPWKCASEHDTYFSMYQSRRAEFWRRQTSTVSLSALDFLETLMTVDQEARPGLDEVRRHDWLKGPKGVSEWMSMIN